MLVMSIDVAGSFNAGSYSGCCQVSRIALAAFITVLLRYFFGVCSDDHVVICGCCLICALVVERISILDIQDDDLVVSALA